MITELPKFYKSFIEALEEAKLYSKDFCRINFQYIYLIRNNTGYYIVDYLKPQYDDERIVHTLLNGEVIL